MSGAACLLPVCGLSSETLGSEVGHLSTFLFHLPWAPYFGHVVYQHITLTKHDLGFPFYFNQWYPLLFQVSDWCEVTRVDE
jgi:hypothetical protein